MEVLNNNAGMLSNHEVHQLLAETRQQLSGGGGRNRPSDQLKNVATIAYQAHKYLEDGVCAGQSAENVRNCATALDGFKLTRAEKLQLINLRPTTPVEVQLIVEESEERLSDEQVQQLLDVVERHLPAAATQDDDAT